MDSKPTLKAGGPTHRFPLTSITPVVKTSVGSVSVCDQDVFPVVTGQAAAVYYVRLEPKGLREPHWHPNCWELNFVVKGQVRLGVVNPDDTFDEVVLNPGDVGFIPQGYLHYLENAGDTECELAICFNNSKPQDIGISTSFAGVPTRTFAATFGVPTEKMEGFNKPDRTLYVVPE
jgi:oxalate decarboxylase